LDWLLCHSKQTSEIAQATALFAAALYFLWKLFTGYLIANMSVESILSRSRLDRGEDLLVISVKLTKGDRESVTLKEIKLQVQTNETEICNVSLLAPFATEARRMIRLTPGEITQFAHQCKVPIDGICYVEVLVKGKAFFFTPMGYWKASAISAPMHVEREHLTIR
jgi:K+-sensing histidine kinase KdpD